HDAKKFSNFHPETRANNLLQNHEWHSCEFGVRGVPPETVRFMDGVHLLLQCVHSRHPWRSNARAYRDVFTACFRRNSPDTERVRGTNSDTVQQLTERTFRNPA